MSADENRVEVESAGSIGSSCSTTTDTASIQSPSAEDYASQQFTSDNMPTRFRKRINNFLRNVSDAPVVGAAFDYVKDVNDRSPLVRSVSGRLRPIVDFASPVVYSVVGRFDDGLDVTCRLVDKCVARGQKLPASLSGDSSPLLNSVASKIEITSFNIRERILLLWTSSQVALEDMSRRKEELYNEIIRRKNSLFDELPSFPWYPNDVIAGFPSRCYDYLVLSFSTGVQFTRGQARLVVEYGQSWAIQCRKLVAADPRLSMVRDCLADRYERTCLLWEMVSPKLSGGWNIVTKEKPASVKRKIAAVHESVRHLAATSADKTKSWVLLVPEERRLTALELNTKLFSLLRRFIGDKKVDSVLGGLRTVLQICQ